MWLRRTERHSRWLVLRWDDWTGVISSEAESDGRRTKALVSANVDDEIGYGFVQRARHRDITVNRARTEYGLFDACAARHMLSDESWHTIDASLHIGATPHRGRVDRSVR